MNIISRANSHIQSSTMLIFTTFMHVGCADTVDKETMDEVLTATRYEQMETVEANPDTPSGLEGMEQVQPGASPAMNTADPSARLDAEPMDDSENHTQSVPDSAADPVTDTDTTSADISAEDGGTCTLDGTAAVKIVAQVSWPDSIAMEAGNGTFEIWFRADMNDDGTHVMATGHVCEVEVPDFRTKPIAGGDTHGTVIPPEAWASGPGTDLVMQLGGRTVGSTLSVNATAMFLGTEMSDPMGAWPRSSGNMTDVDHDGDGYPGVTTFAAMGPGYASPRIALLNQSLRADRIFLGMRNIIGFNGMLTSCERAEGAASLVLDQRAFGCLTTRGNECNNGQTELLDSNLPQFQVQDATFTLAQLPANTDCGAIRATLP